jgi:hypothetical protein
MKAVAKSHSRASRRTASWSRRASAAKAMRSIAASDVMLASLRSVSRALAWNVRPYIPRSASRTTTSGTKTITGTTASGAGHAGEP